MIKNIGFFHKRKSSYLTDKHFTGNVFIIYCVHACRAVCWSHNYDISNIIFKLVNSHFSVTNTHSLQVFIILIRVLEFSSYTVNKGQILSFSKLNTAFGFPME